MEFTVTIVTSPQRELVVHKDVELIKLGLLYADQVTIVSPSIYFILLYVRIATLNEKERIDLLKYLLPSMHGQKPSDIKNVINTLDQYQYTKSKLTKSFDDIKLIIQLEEYLNTSFSKLKIGAESIVASSGIEEILPLLANGKLVIKDFGEDINKAPQLLLEGAIEGINNKLTYPIFDKEITNLVAAYIRENNSSFNLENSKETVVAKDLFLRIPNINNISIDNIILLRTELEMEWYRYKRLVSEYACDIEGMPFEEEAAIKLSKKYDKDFKPQLLELQKSFDKNKFVKHLYNQVLDNISSYSMLCIGAATLLEVKNAIISASGVALAQSMKAFNEVRKQNDNIRENKLYFYHRLSQI